MTNTIKINTVWIVMGCTGEYSDFREWHVAAYEKEADAIAHKEAATKFLQENLTSSNRYTIKNPYDSCMSIDYNGCTYSYFSMPVQKSFVNIPEIV